MASVVPVMARRAARRARRRAVSDELATADLAVGPSQLDRLDGVWTPEALDRLARLVEDVGGDEAVAG